MAQTIRIIHLGTEPLDGTTPLPANVEVVNDPSLGMGVITLQPGQRFGLLDPGQIPYLAGQQSSLQLKSLSLLSFAAPEHQSCPILLSGPLAAGGFQAPVDSRVLEVLGEPGGTGYTRGGLVPTFPPVPIPLGHGLRFDTTPDLGVAPAGPGPHLLQLTFERCLQADNLFSAQNCCPPDPAQDCPQLTSWEPAQVSQAGGLFNGIARGIFFQAGDLFELRPQGQGGPPMAGAVTVDSQTQASIANIDPQFATLGFFDLVLSRPNCPDSILVGALDLQP